MDLTLPTIPKAPVPSVSGIFAPTPAPPVQPKAAPESAGMSTYSPAVLTSTAANDHVDTVVKPALADATAGIQNQATNNANLKVTQDAAAQKAQADALTAEQTKAQTTESKTKTDLMNQELGVPAGWTSADYAAFKQANPTLEPTAEDTLRYQQSGLIDDSQKQLEQAQAEYQNQAKSVSDTILNIQNGSIPLNAGEQAQIAGLQQQFGALIDQQKLTNKGASGLANVRGYQSGAAEYDPTFQVKTIGSIVTAGLNKVADLNVKMASAVAQLTQSFKNDDIAAVKDAYQVFQEASTKRTEALQKTIDDTQTAIKAANDQQQKIQDDVNKIAEEAAKNGATPEVLNKITSSGSVSEALANSTSFLQTATGELGDFLSTNRYLASQGLPTVTLQQFQDQSDSRKARIAAAGRAPTSEKPPTVTQVTYGNYAPRLETADATITTLTPTLSGMSVATFAGEEKLPSFLQTSDVQVYNQAKSNFVNAVLRQESGAAISDAERASYDKQYFPQPGDSEKTIANKAQNRAQVVASYQKAAGPAYVPPVITQVAQTEDAAKQKVVEIGNTDPTVRATVNNLLSQNPEMSYSDVLQVIGP